MNRFGGDYDTLYCITVSKRKAAKALSIFKTHACDRAVTGSIQCLISQGVYSSWVFHGVSSSIYLLQPLLVRDICRLLILHVPSQVQNSKSVFGECLNLCKIAVHSVHLSCPGFLEFSTAVMLANLKMLEGDFSSAKSLLYQSVDKEDSNPEGRIVMAQLHLNEGNLLCCQSLLRSCIEL
ncbi:tetratricopeptide repeat protein 21B [Caerostris extrusa]|uniref:Tetratricopeptide repeat protein 21B n=1 Tax=Caerostris extrusa TaxID=172846 RepID=A0AAV4NUD5_CAEEX|nr:tetratricopeptide repeat protein 21B [Caerostris extrusa]